VAKIACDAAKPGGLKVVPAEETESFLRPLPVRAIPGIGPKSAERLEAIGVRTVGELAGADLERLRRVLGRFGDEVRELARGHPGPGLAELPTEGGPRQRSLDRTLERDTRDPTELYRLLTSMSAELAGTLGGEGLRYQEVIVRLRWQDFAQTQRGVKLAAAREDAASLAAESTRLARELLEREHAGADRAVRRVSLAAGRLVPRRGRQPPLDLYGSEPASR
jgi:nucleotidyltransferase/DNA polymerase involved in DNA repair